MKIKTVVENTSKNKECQHRHGLSFYIETSEHKILFDLGPDQTFLENAEKLNVDISRVDTAVISHGHDDHGGGLETFMAHNNKAFVYIRESAFEPHYIENSGEREYIGLNQALKDSRQIVFTQDQEQIDEELTVFTTGTKVEDISQMNRVLERLDGTRYTQDDFVHEQSLIIEEDGHHVLLAGCAHSGIMNILKKAEAICGQEMDIVIGGFHLFNPVTKETESEEFIKTLAAQLKERKTKYYTCHCTGKKAYQELQLHLKDQVGYMSIGDSLKI